MTRLLKMYHPDGRSIHVDAANKRYFLGHGWSVEPHKTPALADEPAPKKKGGRRRRGHSTPDTEIPTEKSNPTGQDQDSSSS